MSAKEEYTYQIYCNQKNKKPVKILRLSPKFNGAYEEFQETTNTLKDVYDKYKELYNITKPTFVFTDEGGTYDVFVITQPPYDRTKSELSIQG